MKMRITLLSLLIGLASTVTVAQSKVSASIPFADAEDIMLEEDKGKGLRSSYIPITATLVNSAIYINFEKAMGDLTVTISKLNGTVYTSSVRIESPVQEIIYVEDYEPGVYLLKFIKAGGGSIFGYFTIE